MNTSRPFFVGYGTLEALLQSHEPATPPDVRILEGDTDCFHYDTPTDSYIAGPAKGQQVAQG